MIKIRIKGRIKPLTMGLRECGGRSNGLITAPRRGALTKRLYRFLDMKRTMFPGDFYAIAEHYVYDPNRSGFITLIAGPNGVCTYILAVNYQYDQKFVGNIYYPADPNDKGNSQYLKNFNFGSMLSNLSFTTRAAGTGSLLLTKQKGKHKLLRYSVRLPSGEYRLFLNQNIGISGTISNKNHHKIRLERAGQTRLKGIRPRVRLLL